MDGYRGTVVTVGMVGARLAMNLASWCGGPRNTIVNVQKKIEKCSSEHQKKIIKKNKKMLVSGPARFLSTARFPAVPQGE